LNDIDYIELRGLASQSLGVIKEMGMDMNKINLHGGRYFPGHPIGCTGARIIVTMVYEMTRRNLRYAAWLPSASAAARAWR